MQKRTDIKIRNIVDVLMVSLQFGSFRISRVSSKVLLLHAARAVDFWRITSKQIASLIAKFDIPFVVPGSYRWTEANGNERDARRKKIRIRKCKDSKTSFMGRSNEKRSECLLYISLEIASYLDVRSDPHRERAHYNFP